MSEQGFRGVPGVPEGWELVEVRPISEDWTIGSDGKPMFYEGGLTTTWWPVIRKIEQAPKYRPFASAEEFKPHRDRWVTRKDKSDKEAQPGAFHVAAYDDVGYWCSGGVHERFDTAFSHGRCFDDDGTPFGIEVTE